MALIIMIGTQRVMAEKLLLITEKVFAKSGLLCGQFQRKIALSKMVFHISKLLKKEI